MTNQGCDVSNAMRFNGCFVRPFNDFTNQLNDIFFETGGPAPILTCNWWGDAAGPQNVDPSLPTAIFSPWATAPIAGTGGSGCQPDG